MSGRNDGPDAFNVRPVLARTAAVAVQSSLGERPGYPACDVLNQ